MIADYDRAVAFLYDSLPMFQRVGAVAYKADLANTIQLCGALGNPQHNFKSIHIAGTNGKGSVSHMLASILQSAGYKVGLYTSPHLKEFTERIRINGTEIDRAFVVDFVNRIEPQIVRLKPSFFEITVAMAFAYFAAKEVDVAVVEVGLGGRLDSTNVIMPVLSVITNIGLDHVALLGDTISKIAFEKAGIIKERVPVVISQRQPEAQHVFLAKANEMNAPIYFATDRFSIAAIDSDEIDTYHVRDAASHEEIRLRTPLLGRYQSKNILGVLQACELLVQRGFNLTPSQIAHGIEHVVTQTHLKGRWQLLQREPLMVCDTGHNEDGIREVVTQLGKYPYHKLHFVLGMVNDKDVTAVLTLLPKMATYYFCSPKIPRAMPATDLMQAAARHELMGQPYESVNAAIDSAKSSAEKDDLIFVGGSTFVVAEIENL